MFTTSWVSKVWLISDGLVGSKHPVAFQGAILRYFSCELESGGRVRHIYRERDICYETFVIRAPRSQTDQSRISVYTTMVSRPFLQKSAIAISIASLFYNIAEGVISVVFGAESSSHSLIFFGIQSVIEVLSASLVVWRFMNGLKAGEEGNDGSEVRMSKDLRIERIATLAIGILLAMLALAAVGTSIASLIAHEHPSPSNASLIIAASATFIMFLFWVPKRYLAKALNSSTMNGEALCTLSCMQFSGALLIGSLIYRVWRGGWWVDSATAMAIAMLFGWEGFKMIRWASNDEFNGSCCCGQEERKADKQAIPEVMQEPSTAPQRCCGDSGCCKPSQESSNKV